MYIHTYIHIYIHVYTHIYSIMGITPLLYSLYKYTITRIGIPSWQRKGILGGVVQPPTRWTWGTEPSKNGGFTGNMLVINAA